MQVSYQPSITQFMSCTACTINVQHRSIQAAAQLRHPHIIFKVFQKLAQKGSHNNSPHLQQVLAYLRDGKCSLKACQLMRLTRLCTHHLSQ